MRNENCSHFFILKFALGTDLSRYCRFDLPVTIQGIYCANVKSRMKNFLPFLFTFSQSIRGTLLALVSGDGSTPIQCK
jgi:hypothetical protein